MILFRETVNDLLWDILNKLMQIQELKTFRLVGGTSLSLMLGHRKSVDIDLFTDAEYGSINFNDIDEELKNSFRYVDYNMNLESSFGRSYFIGNSRNDTVKVDMFYTDSFAYPVLKIKNLRLSQLEEIIAMKFEVIGNNGRKKDFWDIHELFGKFSVGQMLSFYQKKYSYGYSREELIKKLTDFEMAESDLDPICLKGKYWELIKLDIEEILTNYASE